MSVDESYVVLSERRKTLVLRSDVVRIDLREGNQVLHALMDDELVAVL